MWKDVISHKDAPIKYYIRDKDEIIIQGIKSAQLSFISN